MDAQTRYSRRVSLALLGAPLVSWLSGCGGGGSRTIIEDVVDYKGTHNHPPLPCAGSWPEAAAQATALLTHQQQRQQHEGGGAGASSSAPTGLKRPPVYWAMFSARAT